MNKIDIKTRRTLLWAIFLSVGFPLGIAMTVIGFTKGQSFRAMGIVGMETAFPVLYTKLVREGRVPLERIADAMCVRPREIFRLPAPESLIGIELGTPYTLRASDFATMGRNTPFDEWTVWGRVLHDFD